MSGLIGKAMKFARSPQGKKALDKAQKYVKSPEGKEKLEELKGRVGHKGAPAADPKPAPGAPAGGVDASHAPKPDPEAPPAA